MANNVISIGARFDKALLEGDFSSVQDLTKNAMDGLATSIESANKRSRQAFKDLSVDVKAAAESVSVSSLKIAEATKAQAAAIADLRRASIIAKDSNVDAVTSSLILATAQKSAADAAKALAMAEEEVAVASSHVVPEMAAASASIRVFEGAVPIRAVERFLSTTLGLGPALAAAFPIVGAFVFAEMIAETAKKVYVLYQDVVNLKAANEALDQSDLATAETVKRLGDEAARAHFHFIEMTQGASAARKAMEEFEKKKSIDLSSLFNRGEIRKLSDDIKGGLESSFKEIDPSDLDAKIADLHKRMADVQDIINNPNQHLRHVTSPVGPPADIGPDLVTARTKLRLLNEINDQLSAVVRARNEKAADDAATASKKALEEQKEAARKREEESRRSATVALEVDERELNQQKLTHRLSTEDEYRFWKDKLDAAKQGTALYDALLKRVAPLAQQRDKQQEKNDPLALQPVDDSGMKTAQEETIQGMRDAAKAQEESYRADVDNYRASQEEKIRAASEGFQAVERQTAAEVQLDKMTFAQRLAALRTAAAEELKLKQQAVGSLIALDDQTGKSYQADLNKGLQASREYYKQLDQLNQQAALKFQNDWKKVTTKFNADFTTAFNSVLQHTQNLEQAFAKMFDSILIQLADWAVNWLLKRAETWLLDEAMQIPYLAALRAQQAASNIQTVTGDAAVAAAGAMAYYSATDPPAAPALAAAQFAMTMAYAPMAAFEKGGIVAGMPRMGVPILAHAGERVLTPQQTANFERMVNGGSQTAQRGGDTHNHLHYNGQVNAYDRSGMRSTLKAHAEDILDVVRQGYREGKLAS